VKLTAPLQRLTIWTSPERLGLRPIARDRHTPCTARHRRPVSGTAATSRAH